MAGTAGRRYRTDLTDEQWAILEPLFPERSGPGRPRELDLREVVNAILYLTRTGCQWRLLPKDFPNYTQGGRINVVFVDGHGESIGRESFSRVRISPYRY